MPIGPGNPSCNLECMYEPVKYMLIHTHQYEKLSRCKFSNNMFSMRVSDKGHKYIKTHNIGGYRGICISEHMGEYTAEYVRD